MSTTTRTDTFQQSYRFTYELPAEVDYEKATKELQSILMKHREEDHLSAELWKWGAKTVNPKRLWISWHKKHYPSGPISGKIHFTAPMIREILEERIDKLSKKILINFVDRAGFKKPVVSKEYTWEAWMFEDYIAAYRDAFATTDVPPEPLSPFDGEPLSPATSHLFATKILAWKAAHFPPAGEAATTAGSNRVMALIRKQALPTYLDPEATAKEVDPVSRLLLYCHKARQRLTFLAARELRYEMREAGLTTQQIREETEIRMAQEVAQAKQFAQEQRDYNTKQLNDLKAIFESNVALHKSIADGLRNTVASLQTQLNQAVNINQTNANNLSALHYQQRRLQEENDALRNRSQESSCTIL